VHLLVKTLIKTKSKMKITLNPQNLVKLKVFLVLPLAFSAMIIYSSCVAKKEAPSIRVEAVRPSVQGSSASIKPHYEIKGNDTIYYAVNEAPQFPGGQDALQKFKNKNVKYPRKIKSLGIEGVEVVWFVVEKDGTLSNIRISQGISPALDAEALRITRLMPAWIPGKIEGKPVRTMYGTVYEYVASAKKQSERTSESVVKNNPDDPETPYVVVEEMPMFPGGDAELLKFIAENTKYPEAAKTNNIQGRVIVRFCVTKEGGIDRVSVLKGVNPDLDNEATRVVKTLPAFKPGKQGGNPVNVWYMVPITFALASNETTSSETKKAESSDISKMGYDEPPVYPGGEEAMYKFIGSNIRYPEQAKEKKISGKVIVRFCINSDGTINSVSASKKVDPDLDNEAVRVVTMLHGWEPGKLHGTPARIWYSIPVIFTLK
jgi:TonB family protein